MDRVLARSQPRIIEEYIHRLKRHREACQGRLYLVGYANVDALQMHALSTFRWKRLTPCFHAFYPPRPGDDLPPF